jgi:hypothetical protein
MYLHDKSKALEHRYQSERISAANERRQNANA